ncbi:MAG: toll/interleukin-1 receptor domain-containing protein [Rhizobiaceae bacterium]
MFATAADADGVANAAAYAAEVTVAARFADTASSAVARTASCAANAAAYAAYVVDVTAFAAADHTARVAVDAASAVYAADADADAERRIWSAIRADAKALDGGMPSDELAREPLWTLGIPRWFVQERLGFFRCLSDLGHDWPLWSEWLGRRIAGENTAGLPDNLAEELDIQIATQPDEWWSRDPVAVNADIASWIEEAKAESEDFEWVDDISETWDFFISYANEDHDAAIEIEAILASLGYSTLSQFRNTATGSDLTREIASGLKSGGRLIALYSPDYEKSDLCQAEWLEAFNAGPDGRQRKLIPLMLRPTALNQIAQEVWYESLVDLDASQRRQVIINLLESLDDPQESDRSDNPSIPPQQPAPLETEIRDQKVVERPDPVGESPAGTAPTHSLLRAECAALSQRLRGQLPDAGSALDGCGEALGSVPEAVNVYAVGYWYGILAEIAPRVDERLMDDAAGRYAGFLLNLKRYVDQFEEWRTYVSIPDIAAFAEDLGRESVEAANAIVDAIEAEPDIVSDTVSGKLAALKQALVDTQQYNPETIYGFVRSVANVTQTLAELALLVIPGSVREKLRETAIGFAGDVARDFRKESSKTVVRAAIVGLINVFGGMTTQLLGLSVQHPYMFGWVQPFLKFLGFAV